MGRQSIHSEKTTLDAVDRIPIISNRVGEVGRRRIISPTTLGDYASRTNEFDPAKRALIYQVRNTFDVSLFSGHAFIPGFNNSEQYQNVDELIVGKSDNLNRDVAPILSRLVGSTIKINSTADPLNTYGLYTLDAVEDNVDSNLFYTLSLTYVDGTPGGIIIGNTEIAIDVFATGSGSDGGDSDLPTVPTIDGRYDLVRTTEGLEWLLVPIDQTGSVVSVTVVEGIATEIIIDGVTTPLGGGLTADEINAAPFSFTPGWLQPRGFIAWEDAEGQGYRGVADDSIDVVVNPAGTPTDTSFPQITWDMLTGIATEGSETGYNDWIIADAGTEPRFVVALRAGFPQARIVCRINIADTNTATTAGAADSSLLGGHTRVVADIIETVSISVGDELTNIVNVTHGNVQVVANEDWIVCEIADVSETGNQLPDVPTANGRYDLFRTDAGLVWSAVPIDQTGSVVSVTVTDGEATAITIDGTTTALGGGGVRVLQADLASPFNYGLIVSGVTKTFETATPVEYIAGDRAIIISDDGTAWASLTITEVSDSTNGTNITGTVLSRRGAGFLDSSIEPISTGAASVDVALEADITSIIQGTSVNTIPVLAELDRPQDADLSGFLQQTFENVGTGSTLPAGDLAYTTGPSNTLLQPGSPWEDVDGLRTGGLSSVPIFSSTSDVGREFLVLSGENYGIFTVTNAGGTSADVTLLPGEFRGVTPSSDVTIYSSSVGGEFSRRFGALGYADSIISQSIPGEFGVLAVLSRGSVTSDTPAAADTSITIPNGGEAGSIIQGLNLREEGQALYMVNGAETVIQGATLNTNQIQLYEVVERIGTTQSFTIRPGIAASDITTEWNVFIGQNADDRIFIEGQLQIIAQPGNVVDNQFLGVGIDGTIVTNPGTAVPLDSENIVLASRNQTLDLTSISHVPLLEATTINLVSNDPRELEAASFLVQLPDGTAETPDELIGALLAAGDTIDVFIDEADTATTLPFERNNTFGESINLDLTGINNGAGNPFVEGFSFRGGNIGASTFTSVFGESQAEQVEVDSDIQINGLLNGEPIPGITTVDTVNITGELNTQLTPHFFQPDSTEKYDALFNSHEAGDVITITSPLGVSYDITILSFTGASITIENAGISLLPDLESLGGYTAPVERINNRGAQRVGLDLTVEGEIIFGDGSTLSTAPSDSESITALSDLPDTVVVGGVSFINGLSTADDDTQEGVYVGVEGVGGGSDTWKNIANTRAAQVVLTRLNDGSNLSEQGTTIEFTDSRVSTEINSINGRVEVDTSDILGNLSALPQTGATLDQVITWSPLGWIPADKDSVSSNNLSDGDVPYFDGVNGLPSGITVDQAASTIDTSVLTSITGESGSAIQTVQTTTGFTDTDHISFRTGQVLLFGNTALTGTEDLAVATSWAEITNIRTDDNSIINTSGRSFDDGEFFLVYTDATSWCLFQADYSGVAGGVPVTSLPLSQGTDEVITIAVPMLFVGVPPTTTTTIYRDTTNFNVEDAVNTPDPIVSVNSLTVTDGTDTLTITPTTTFDGGGGLSTTNLSSGDIPYFDGTDGQSSSITVELNTGSFLFTDGDGTATLSATVTDYNHSSRVPLDGTPLLSDSGTDYYASLSGTTLTFSNSATAQTAGSFSIIAGNVEHVANVTGAVTSSEVTLTVGQFSQLALWFTANGFLDSGSRYLTADQFIAFKSASIPEVASRDFKAYGFDDAVSSTEDTFRFSVPAGLTSDTTTNTLGGESRVSIRFISAFDPSVTYDLNNKAIAGVATEGTLTGGNIVEVDLTQAEINAIAPLGEYDATLSSTLFSEDQILLYLADSIPDNAGTSIISTTSNIEVDGTVTTETLTVNDTLTAPNIPTHEETANAILSPFAIIPGQGSSDTITIEPGEVATVADEPVWYYNGTGAAQTVSNDTSFVAADGWIRYTTIREGGASTPTDIEIYDVVRSAGTVTRVTEGIPTDYDIALQLVVPTGHGDYTGTYFRLIRTDRTFEQLRSATIDGDLIYQKNY